MQAFAVVAYCTVNGAYEYDYNGTVYPYFNLPLAERDAAAMTARAAERPMAPAPNGDQYQNEWRVDTMEVDPAAGCWGWVTFLPPSNTGRRSDVKDCRIRNIVDNGDGSYRGVIRRWGGEWCVTLPKGSRNWICRERTKY